MAVLSFTSSGSYELANVGDVKSVSSGSSIYVAGFPLPTTAVPGRPFHFLEGVVIAAATVAIPNGYQLLYSSQALPGMIGGPVLSAQGKVVGIHASTDHEIHASTKNPDQTGEISGGWGRKGDNQGVPIVYYRQHSSGAPIVASSSQPETADDYLAQVKVLSGKKGSEQEVIELAGEVLAKRQIAEAYFYRANAKRDLGDEPGAISDYSKAIAINPKYADAYFNRGLIKSNLGYNRGAIADYSQVIAIDPLYVSAYFNRAAAKFALGELREAILDFGRVIAIDSKHAIAYYSRGHARYVSGDLRGAVNDYNQAIAIDPQYVNAYSNLGVVKFALGDLKGAIKDFGRVIAIDPQFVDSYRNRGLAYESIGDLGRACADWRTAASLGDADAAIWVDKQCQSVVHKESLAHHSPVHR